MTKKWLIFSDLHLNESSRVIFNPTYDSKSMSGQLRLGLEALDQIVKITRDNDISNVFFCGDFFELKDKIPNHMTEVASYTLSCMKAENIWLLRGNHDSRREGDTTLGFLNSFPRMEIIKSNKMPLIDDIRVGFIPHTRRKYQEEFINMVQHMSDNGCSHIFAHQNVLGYSFPNIERDLVIFTGHLHKFDRLQIGPSFAIIYPGSPYQTDFNEEGDLDKCVLLLDPYTKTLETKLIDNPIRITVPPMKLKSFQAVPPETFNGKIVRIKGHLTIEEYSEFSEIDLSELLFEEFGATGFQREVGIITQNVKVSLDDMRDISNKAQVIRDHVEAFDEKQLPIDKETLIEYGTKVIGGKDA